MKESFKTVTLVFIILVITITFLFAISLSWNIRKVYQSSIEYARIEAHASFSKDILYRRWAAMHGGVYAPISDHTPPNPNLEFIAERDIITPSGKKLTLINPAYMTRQVFELMESEEGTKSHITSLHPIREKNQADKWETQALKSFSVTKSTISNIENIDGKEYLRFMHSMRTEQNCLKCHASQGYKLGDIRGGISISVPMDKYNEIIKGEIINLSLSHVVGYLIVLAISLFGYKKLKSEFVKRSIVQKRLIESEANLLKHNIELKIAKQDLEQNEFNLKERIKELNGIYSLTLLAEFTEDHEEIFKKFVTEIAPKSMQYPEKAYVLLQIGEKKYTNMDDFHFHPGKKHLSAAIKTFNSKIGNLYVSYTEDLDFIEGYEQKFVNMCAERISVIIERKIAETKLIESEEKFRATFEQAGVGVAILDTLTGKYLKINKKYCNIVGFSQAEMLQKTFMEVTHPEDVAINIFSNKKLVDGEHEVFGYDKRYIHKNGEIVWGRLTTSPLWKAGEKHDVYMHIAILEDITTRKQTELALKENEEKLRKLNETKDKLFSIIAHDLKNPIGAIYGFSELLEKKLNDQNYEKAKQYISHIKVSAKNNLNLLDNLMTWAKNQTNKNDFSPKTLSFTAVIIEIIELMTPSANLKNIKINFDSQKDEIIFADENMLKTILRNLISNAIKYTEPQGQITINIESYATEQKISIEDNGTGMDKTTLDGLFKIGETTSRCGTNGETGTGLGLIICKEFVERHKGKIWAESEINNGSVFYITLPSQS